jgi:hypothetical protein
LYREATYDLNRVAGIITGNALQTFRLTKAEALYRLASIENLFERADRAYWHAEEASSLAAGVDGDLYLLAKKQQALACQQLGRSGWREGLNIIRMINQLQHGMVITLGKRFPNQDAGLWARLTLQDAASLLLRHRERIEARDALAELRRALRFHEEAIAR